MAVLTLEFTDTEMEALRQVAEREGRPIERVAHDALVQTIMTRRHIVADAGAHVDWLSRTFDTR